MTIWRRDPSWVRLDPTTVSGGSPRRLWRVSAGGRRLLDALETSSPLPPGHEILTDAMIAAGALHPRRDPTEATQTSRERGDLCSVVIPTRGDEPDRLDELVESIRSELGANTPIVIVDDAAPLPLRPRPGTTVVRTPRRLGPSGARMTGLETTTTPWVLCLDDDVELVPGSLDAVWGHVEDPRVALIAPRIRGPVPSAHAIAGRFTAVSWRERHERDRSPLDLGAIPAEVAPGSRVGYVPAAAILLRRRSVDEIGGFDSSMRVGEDVDLVWRLVDAGWSVRYEPDALVHHRARPTWGSWWRQRHGYGTSAAALARRHGRHAAPVRLGAGVAATWMIASTRHRMSAAAAALATTGWTITSLRRRRVPSPWRWGIIWSLAAQGGAVRQLARAGLRVWSPLLAVTALFSIRARRWVGLAMGLSMLLDATGPGDARVSARLARSLIGRLDDLAYAGGVWAGSWQHRHIGALVPFIAPLQSETT